MSRLIVLASFIAAATTASAYSGICPASIGPIASVAVTEHYVNGETTYAPDATYAYAFALTDGGADQYNQNNATNGCSTGKTFITRYADRANTATGGCDWFVSEQQPGSPVATATGCTYTFIDNGNSAAPKVYTVDVQCNPLAFLGLQIKGVVNVTAPVQGPILYSFSAEVSTACGPDATTTVTDATTVTNATTTEATTVTDATTTDATTTDATTVTDATTDATTVTNATVTNATTTDATTVTDATTTEATTTQAPTTTTTAAPTPAPLTNASFFTNLWEYDLVAAIRTAINVTAAPALRASADGSITASCNVTQGYNHTCEVSFSVYAEAVEAVDAANKGAMPGVYSASIDHVTTTAPKNNDDSSEQNAVGIAIGIIAGIVIAFALFSALYAVVSRKNRYRMSEADYNRSKQYEPMISDLKNVQ